MQLASLKLSNLPPASCLPVPPSPYLQTERALVEGRRTQLPRLRRSPPLCLLVARSAAVINDARRWRRPPRLLHALWRGVVTRRRRRSKHYSKEGGKGGLSPACSSISESGRMAALPPRRPLAQLLPRYRNMAPGLAPVDMLLALPRTSRGLHYIAHRLSVCLI